jgi:hypothetical protein
MEEKQRHDAAAEQAMRTSEPRISLKAKQSIRLFLIYANHWHTGVSMFSMSKSKLPQTMLAGETGRSAAQGQ